MVCLNCCGIAVVFAVAMIYMCVLAPLFLEENKYSLIRKLKDTLTVEQQNKFDRIKRERMSIHMRGYGYGLMASGVVLLYKYKSKSKLLTSSVMLCLTASITFSSFGPNASRDNILAKPLFFSKKIQNPSENLFE